MTFKGSIEMRRTSLLQLIIVFLFVQLFFGKAIAADRTHEIGVQAYIYAYPMIMKDVD